MRLIKLKITKWRAFENVEFSIPKNSPVACIVGANGSGKSQILELIAACAQQVGLANGFESNRPSPFGEEGSFEVTFFIEPDIIPEIEDPAAYSAGALQSWDRTLTLNYTKENNVSVSAGKSDEAVPDFSGVITTLIRQSKSVHFLTLDADRSYPKMDVPQHELPQVFTQDWGAQTRASSYRSTKNLYQEWYRFFIGSENQSNSFFAQKTRAARDLGEPDPRFVDIFDEYKSSLKSILPGLLFVGVEPQTHAVRFSVDGKPISFDQLSGGEREIAFIVGQVDRFALRKGLLLIDEPELHLNADLLRRWIGFLRDTVRAGQIWLATHSLEVVEVCGQSSSFLIEKDPTTRKISKLSRLAENPMVVALSRALGTPAFSIARLKFVFIEGEEELGERERFRIMTACGPDVRFIEAGSCSEVQKRIATMKQLAESAGQPTDTRGIIDRDWRGAAECEKLEKEGLHVLVVHELENFFLEPQTIEHHLASMGRKDEDYFSILQSATDARAGTWIFDSARTQNEFKNYPAPSKETRELVHNLKWKDFEDIDAQCSKITEKETAFTSEQKIRLHRHLVVRAKIYRKVRDDKEQLWQRCEGKEVFASLVQKIGFSNREIAERALGHLWSTTTLKPAGLSKACEYIERI